MKTSTSALMGLALLLTLTVGAFAQDLCCNGGACCEKACCKSHKK